MSRRFVCREIALLTTLLLSGGGMLWPIKASAETPLTQAVITTLRHPATILLPAAQPYPASVNSTLASGGSLVTSQATLAELQFNDGSLVRVGEQAVFRFTPGTRILQLTHGTVLVLVPAGQGQTRLQTPNATADFQGSALFVRYIPATDVTLIGSLTDSGVAIANRDQSQRQSLTAGQLAVVVKDRIEQVYGFDLNAFYATSTLVEGLDLNQSTVSARSTAAVGTAITTIRTQTTAAANAQGCREEPKSASADQPPTRSMPTAGSPCATEQTATLDRRQAPATADASTTSLTQLAPASAALPLAIPPTVALPTTNPDATSALTTAISRTSAPLPLSPEHPLPPGRLPGVTLASPPGVLGAPPPETPPAPSTPPTGGRIAPPTPPPN